MALMKVYKAVQKRYFSCKPLLDVIFYVVFCYAYIYVFATTSMLDPYTKHYIWAQSYYNAVKVLLIVAGLQIFEEHPWWQRVLSAALLVSAFIYWQHFHRGNLVSFDVLTLCILLVAAGGRSEKKILQLTWLCGSIMMICLYVMTLTGFIPDLVFEGGRHAFGLCYYAVCNAHIFYLIVVYLWLRKGELKIWEHIGMAIIIAICLIYVKGRTSTACIILVWLVTLWNQYGGQFADRFRKIVRPVRLIELAVFPLLAAITITAAAFYDGTWKLLNMSSSFANLRSRLRIGHRTLTEFALHWFGTSIPQAGNGFNTEQIPKDIYFFIDISYIKLLMEYGLALFILFMLIAVLLQLKYFREKQYYKMAMLSAVAINCIMYHHIIELCFNVFFILLYTTDDYRLIRKRTGKRIEP